MNTKRILSIQDVSCVGQCSLTVALPLVSACGVECAGIPAAVLSNHTGGFKKWTFADLTGELPKIERAWIDQGIKFDGFYTGYVCESQIDPILSIMETCAAPGAARIVDPAMADNGKLYTGFAPDFPSKMARLCKGADYLLPNLTEASLLAGLDPASEYNTPADIERLLAALEPIGAKTVVLTGVGFSESELGCAIASAGEKPRYVFKKRLGRMCHGTGDIFASVFAGAAVRGRSAEEAASLAAETVCRSILATPEDHWYGACFEKAIPFVSAALSGD